MWRSWPLAVPFILRALIASASLLWMLMNAAHAQGTLITYVRTPDDSVISQMLIKETTIHDYRMNLFDNGTNPFNFVAVEFTVNNSGKYFFGQQEAPMDTVMLLYKGSFDPNAVKTNLVAANDDWYRFDGNKMGTNYNTQTPADTCAKEAYSCISLDANTTLALKRCGTATRLCPGLLRIEDDTSGAACAAGADTHPASSDSNYADDGYAHKHTYNGHANNKYTHDGHTDNQYAQHEYPSDRYADNQYAYGQHTADESQCGCGDDISLADHARAWFGAGHVIAGLASCGCC
jgi:hypothetical protein